MSSARLAEDTAWLALRRYSTVKLFVEAFARFRYGDGFSHSRALGLQISLASVPLVIAVVGLSRALHTPSVSELVRRTFLPLAPGSSEGALATALRPAPIAGGDVDELAMLLGLGFALVALTTAMGQVERGANRIYGIERDRPTILKYARAFVMAVSAGIPAMSGVVMLLAASTFGDAVEAVYGVDDDLVTLPGMALGALLVAGSVTVMLRWAPRRRQPTTSWLLVGTLVAITLWLAVTALFGGYLQVSDNFTEVYGPLTGVMALLLWAQLTATALLYGLAFCAQLEARHAGLRDGAREDPEPRG